MKKNVLSNMKKAYDNIEIPEELQERVKQGIKTGKQKEGKNTTICMKWSFRIGSVIAAAVLAFGLLLHFNEKAAYALSKVPVLGNVVKIVTFRDFEDNTGEMSASVRVPEVKVTGKDQKADEDASKKLNAQIKKYTDKIIDEYWKDVKETKGKGRENVTIDYEVVTNTKRLFSLKINSSVQINTSSDEAKVYHIDKKTGKCITLEDIFKDNTDYRAVLTKEIKKQMRNNMKTDKEKVYFIDKKGMNWTGVGKEADFYINNKKELVMLFDKYEVAPGYMGACQFCIPQERIQNIIKKEYFVK